jgi:hypothetical protein
MAHSPFTCVSTLQLLVMFSFCGLCVLHNAGQRASGGGSGAYIEWRSLPVNACADDARFVKAAVMAGFYPSVLRVQHPDATYKRASDCLQEFGCLRALQRAACGPVLAQKL